MQYNPSVLRTQCVEKPWYTLSRDKAPSRPALCCSTARAINTALPWLRIRTTLCYWSSNAGRVRKPNAWLGRPFKDQCQSQQKTQQLAPALHRQKQPQEQQRLMLAVAALPPRQWRIGPRVLQPSVATNASPRSRRRRWQAILTSEEEAMLQSPERPPGARLPRTADEGFRRPPAAMWSNPSRRRRPRRKTQP